MSAADRALTERLRAELAATAERERIADVVVKDAMREWRDAKNAHRAARKAYDDARAAEEYARTHPGLFDEDEVVDCSGVIGAGGLVYSDADPGL